MKMLIICLMFSLQSFAYKSSTFSASEFKSENINVYGKGYRYANRIFYREKRAASKKCAKRFEDLNLELQKFSSVEVELKDIGIKVSVGKRATIQFSCEVRLESESKMNVHEFEFSLENTADCERAEEDLKNEIKSELVFSSFSRNTCYLQAITL